MTYEKFDIISVAQNCGLVLKRKGNRSAEYVANCPFCGDTKYHLGINSEKEQFQCFHCGTTGNSVSLYAKLHGISNKDAYMTLKRNTTERAWSFTPLPAKPEVQMKPLMDRHNVYYDMLSMLYLETKHRNNLQGRGLNFAEINRFMYKSTPNDVDFRREVIKKLSNKYDLIGIPGFYRGKNGEIQMFTPKYGGIFIPYCDKDGYIQGLQIRLDLPEVSDEKKFRWFSTSGFDEGTKAEAWVHVVGDITSKVAYLTEGGMKGDISSVLSGGKLILAVPGVQAIANLLKVIRELGIEKIYECFDMDKIFNPHVRAALMRLRQCINEMDVEFVGCKWNPINKGLDDYFFAKTKATAQIAA